MKGFTAFLIACVIGIGAIGCGGGSSKVPSQPATLTAVNVKAASSSLVAGQNLQLTATATYSDNSTQDVTSSSTWQTSDPTIAAVSNTGLLSGVKAGGVTITAIMGTVTGTMPFTINPPTTPPVTPATLVSIQITPPSATITAGQAIQFTATGTYSDNSTQNLNGTAIWSSTNQAVAKVNPYGVVTAVAAGQVSLTAVSGSISSAPAQVTVNGIPATLSSIVITPASISLTAGQTHQLAATGVYSDNSTQDLTGTVTWASTNLSVAGVSASGMVSAVAAGQASVTAASGSVSSLPALIAVTPAPPSLASIVITPLSTSLAMGQSQQLTATGVYSDSSTQDLTGTVTWASTNPSVASVSASGMAAAVGTGQSSLTAAYSSITSAPASINVTAAALTSIAVAPTAVSIATGETQQFSATGLFSDGSAIDITNSVMWASDTLAVATLSPTGLATGVGVGTANVSATSGTVVGTDPLTVTAAVLQSIDISPDSQSVPVGGQVPFTVTGTFSDGSSQMMANATYSSSNPAIASIDPVSGIATGVAANSNAVTITATLGGFTDTASLTVLPPTLQSIAVTPLTATVTAGSTVQFALTGVFSDGSAEALTQSVSWSSSLPSIAGIDANGLASGVAPGQITIGAAYGGLTASAALTVELGAPVSLTVTPGLLSLGTGGTQQFTATAVFGDGSSQDLTSQVQWISSAASVALISNTGLANAVGLGTAQITAEYQGLSGSATLTVAAIKLVSINVTPATPVVPAHTRIQFTAIGVFSDGSTSPLSGVSWKSTTSKVGNINRSGLVWTRNTGSTTISATLNGITGNTLLTVSSTALVSLTITPANPTIAPGTEQQFALIGTYANGTQVDLTKSAYWWSSNWHDAFVWGGLATAWNSGQVTITAIFWPLTAQTTLTVSNATIASVAVTPAAPSITLGSSQQFAATGTFSDGTAQDITAVSQWTSSDQAVAVTNWKGLASSAGRGTSNINATFKGVSGTGVLTVN